MYTNVASYLGDNDAIFGVFILFSVSQFQILDGDVWISLFTNTLQKGMNPSILDK